MVVRSGLVVMEDQVLCIMLQLKVVKSEGEKELQVNKDDDTTLNHGSKVLFDLCQATEELQQDCLC
jgi:hypothetical protein